MQCTVAFRLSIQSLIHPVRIICLQWIGSLKYLLLQSSLALALQLLFLFSLELSIDLCTLGRFVAVSASLVVAVSFFLLFSFLLAPKPDLDWTYGQSGILL